jgi:hypothetical protein
MAAHASGAHGVVLERVDRDTRSAGYSRDRVTGVEALPRRVTQEGGCRIVVCRLPSKSPWLNSIEPKWVHGKRVIAEPDRKLGVDELKHRICTSYECELLEPIAQ